MRCPRCKEFLDLAGTKFCPSCGHAIEVAAQDPLVGQLLANRYTVKYLVAEGGMGRVYAAEQAMGKTSRKVAIKVLLAEYSGRDQDTQRFLRECSTVSELEHPNTIKFYDYGETAQGDLFIAMEFLSGQSLAQILKDGPLSPERVDLVVGQLCGSLQEAHDHGIVHRDLKPDNIILTSPGGAPDFVKVLDFGIAKRVDSRDPKLTPLGVVLGSPPYMSPEQFTMQEVDARSDIYSLGVVAYQMLTGKLPFNANDPLEWAALHMGVAPAPVDSHGVPVPFEMRCAVHRALGKEPHQRPQSMREFFGEFTIGTGTMAPGRASSMLPTPASIMPFPPPPRAPAIDGGRSSSHAPPAKSPRAGSIPPSAAPTTDRAATPHAEAHGPPPSDPDSEQRTRVKRDSEGEAPTYVKQADPSPATLVLGPEGLAPPVPPPSLGSSEPATIRDPASAPDISFHEMSASEISLPPGETAAMRSSKGTIVMAASEPPPRRARVTMPDLLPPTIRDASELSSLARPRRRYAWIALILVLVGALASGLGWFLFLREGATSSKPKKKAPSTTATSPTATASAPPAGPTSAPPLSSAAVPSSVASAEVSAERPEDKEKKSPCQTVIFSAVSGKCDLARRAYQRCPEDSPYRASATRAVTGLCP